MDERTHPEVHLHRLAGRETLTPETPGTPEILDAYAERVCRNINKILKRAGTSVNADTSILQDGSSLAVCRLTQVSVEQAKSPGRNEGKTSSSLLAEIPEDLRSRVRSMMASGQEALVYEDAGFWMLKAADPALWSQESARNDTARIMDGNLGDAARKRLREGARTKSNTPRGNAEEGK